VGLSRVVSNGDMRSSSVVILRRVISWFVVVQGILLGLLILVVLGRTEAPAHAPAIVIITLIAGLAPILASFVATRNPRRASRIVMWVAPIALLALPRFDLGFRVAIVVVSGATVIPGLFWLFVSRRNWPLPLQTPLFPQRSSLAGVGVSGLLCTLLATSVFLSLFLPWWPLIGDCSGGPLLNEQGAPSNIDFTARIVFVGPRTFHGWSLWSVARIERRFSDVPWSVSDFVILRDFFRPTDKFERFFIEGVRSQGVFDRFLPIVERAECGHSRRLNDAVVELRVLEDGPPPFGVRIIGRVLFGDRSKPGTPSPGTEILIKGPAGRKLVVTDVQGIYDVTGLPPGRYSVELSTKDWHPAYALDLQRVAVGDSVLFLNEARRPGIY
jgi:hypothetical protein